jgi:hypothetical protein
MRSKSENHRGSGGNPAPDNQTYNTQQRSVRWRGERGLAPVGCSGAGEPRMSAVTTECHRPCQAAVLGLPATAAGVFGWAAGIANPTRSLPRRWHAARGGAGTACMWLLDWGDLLSRCFAASGLSCPVLVEVDVHPITPPPSR